MCALHVFQLHVCYAFWNNPTVFWCFLSLFSFFFSLPFSLTSWYWHIFKFTGFPQPWLVNKREYKIFPVSLTVFFISRISFEAFFFFLTVSILNSLSGNSRICVISESVCKACFVFLGCPFLPCLVICSQLSVCPQNMNQHRQSCVPVPCTRAGRGWFGFSGCRAVVDKGLQLL